MVGKRKARTLTLACLAILPLLACSNRQIAQPGNLYEFTEQLDTMIPRLLRQYEVPGAAVALIHNGEVVWTQGYGLADKANGIPVTPDTVFQVASISKSVSAWGVMRLVEAGRLNLDAPVEQYLTRWHLPPSESNHDGVTIRRLLSHTAGLSLHGPPGFDPDHPLPTLEEWLSGATGGASDVRVVLQPGSEFSYSGGGYTLLQLVIEEVSGEPFASFMQREVLAPLGMAHSGFEWTPDLQSATATAYGVYGRPLPNYLFTAKAAAGLYTTASSLARFVATGMMPGLHGEPPGRGVLAPVTLERMFFPAAGTNGRYGLGYRTERLPNGTRIVSHSGANRGWKAQFAALPKKGEGIVILTNSDMGGDLTADVTCVWSAWAAGDTGQVCQVVQTQRNRALVVAGVLGLGLVVYGGWVATEMRAGRRRLGWTWRRVLFFALALLDAALWWVLWYTDAVSVVSESWKTSAPRMLMPATFDWVTLTVTLWGLVVAVTCLAPKEKQPHAADTRAE